MAEVVADLRPRYQAAVTRLVEAKALRDAHLAQAKALRQKAEAALAFESDWAAATEILLRFEDQAGANLRADIERLVSHGLSSVFGVPMAFRTEARVLRNAPVVEFSLEVDGVRRPVLGSYGGGVANIVAFVLRVVVTMLTPGTRKLLVLDEPFAHVSVSYRPALAAFVREVVDATDLQLIIVTHDDELPAVADSRLLVSKNAAGETVVREAAGGE